MNESVEQQIPERKEINNLYSYHDYINLQTYSAFVERLARERSSELISNGFDEHARVIIKNLLLNANESINIFTSSLRNEIYGHKSVIEALKKFLTSSNKRINIVMQDINLKDSDIYDNTIEQLKEKRDFIKICLALSNGNRYSIARSSVADSEQVRHFIIMDETGYRFCPDKTSSTAVASFNQPEKATIYLKEFNELLSRSTILSSSHL